MHKFDDISRVSVAFYISNCESGVNLMSFDKKIHKNDASAHKATPPHPKSSEYDVLKIRAPKRFWAIRAEPRRKRCMI
jgi:hypothetical protein